MALIVEDGTIVAGAESYISVADADTYLGSRGMTIWSGMSPTEKEQALRRATDFMVARYRGRWKGAKVKYEQELDWPRQGVAPDDVQTPLYGQYGFTYVIPYTTIPKEVKRCCAELALKAAAGPLVEDATQKVIQETVGPITTKYDINSPTYVRYSQVDMILAPMLTSGGSSAMVKLSRC